MSQTSMIVTRFAPSPTGHLHLGGARTALFNWLQARHEGGQFLLRIEDTDNARSSKQYLDSIIESLKWLGLHWDQNIVFQSHRLDRHREIVEDLLRRGMAYKCYMTQTEIEEMKQQMIADAAPHNATQSADMHKRMRIISPWRNKLDSEDARKKYANKPFVVRIRASQDSESVTIKDMVQGDVSVPCNEIDDMVLLRSDGTPTYMLASVVDDHDMGVNTIIRGDDHLTNTFRQLSIYKAMSWTQPQFAHIPLVHNPDGTKLSKRHGAKNVLEYRKMGYLPDALVNFLLRLGWGGDGKTETIQIDEAISKFSISDASKSSARLDTNKLNNFNSHYISLLSPAEVSDAIISQINDETEENIQILRERIHLAHAQITKRSNTLADMAHIAKIYIRRAEVLDAQSKEVLQNPQHVQIVENAAKSLQNYTQWSSDNLKAWGTTYAKECEIKPGHLMKILRSAILGDFQSPGVYDVMSIIGKSEALDRINLTLQEIRSS